MKALVPCLISKISIRNRWNTENDDNINVNTSKHDITPVNEEKELDKELTRSNYRIAETGFANQNEKADGFLGLSIIRICESNNSYGKKTQLMKAMLADTLNHPTGEEKC